MKRTINILYLILAVFLCSNAEAKKMTLEECISSALENNLLIRIEQGNIERIRLLIGTAFDAPNTSIELSQITTEGGSPDNGLKFSQEFDFPTLYAAKRKVLKAEYSLAQDAYNQKVNELLNQVVSEYYSLLFVSKKLATLAMLDSVYTRFCTIAQARFNAGETSRLELINAERQKGKIDIEIRAVEKELADKTGSLMLLVGIEETIQPAENELTVLEMPDLINDFFPEQTLKGKIAEGELKLSEKNLGLARQEFMPGLFVGATSQLLIKSFNPYHIERNRFEKGNFMGFQVGITIPLFFGAKRARLLAARRDVEIARLKMEDLHNALHKEYNEAKNEYLAARQNLDYYENKGIAQANEISRLAQVSYDFGEIDYIEYIQNIETASSIRLEYIEAIERYNQAIVKLQKIKGIL